MLGTTSGTTYKFQLFNALKAYINFYPTHLATSKFFKYTATNGNFHRTCVPFKTEKLTARQLPEAA